MQQRDVVVLFDGVCNFCNATINFLIRQDKKNQLRFAALQSTAGQKLLQQHGLPQKDHQSFVLVENGRYFQKTTAALRLLPYLSWYWQWARLGWLLPAFVRNALYNVVAKNRYRWFGKKDACMIPPPHVRARFL